MTGAVQHHCDIQTHSISSLLDTITHLTPGTQPRQEPRQPDPATYRQTGSPATRQPGSTRQHPAAPGSAPTLSQPGSTRQHPAAPGSRPGSRPGKPGTRQHPATRQTPGNTPATRQPDPATPGNPATRAQDNIQTHYDELLKLIIRAQAPQRQREFPRARQGVACEPRPSAQIGHSLSCCRLQPWPLLRQEPL